MYGNKSIWGEFKDEIFANQNVLYQIIFANVAIFVLSLFIPALLALFKVDASMIQRELMNWFAIPSEPLRFLMRPWTIVTYMFLHSGFWHILWNMLFLYWFGRIFQEYLGDEKLLTTFFMGGFAGAFVYLLAYNVFPLLIENRPPLGMVGASAGVSAVLVGAATLLPNFSIRLLLLGNVKLKYIAIFFVILDFLRISGSNAGGHFAHLGGAAYGFFFVRQLQIHGKDWGLYLVNFMKIAKGIFSSSGKSKSNFKVHRNQNAGSATSTSTSSSRVPQDEIDRILDKIAESGYDSLSKEEKDTLFKAGKN